MIAFTSNRGGSHQIYVMNSDGSDQRPLTRGFDHADAAAWSPDGTKIAFAASRQGSNPEIYVMNADGSGQTQLTNQPKREQDWINIGVRPSWSPDGAQMAFTVGTATKGHRTFVINADGSGKHVLSIPTWGWPEIIESADWSPDGTKFVFVAGGVCVMKADGSEGTKLTSGNHRNPVWSPDGKKIAFNGPGPMGTGIDIYVMNADGSGVIKLTDSKYARSEPAWSPDGQKLAFHMDPLSNNSDIYVMNANGSGEARLTSDRGDDSRPHWHPKQRRGRPVDSGRPRIGPGGPSVLSG